MVWQVKQGHGGLRLGTARQGRRGMLRMVRHVKERYGEVRSVKVNYGRLGEQASEQSGKERFNGLQIKVNVRME